MSTRRAPDPFDPDKIEQLWAKFGEDVDYMMKRINDPMDFAVAPGSSLRRRSSK